MCIGQFEPENPMWGGFAYFLHQPKLWKIHFFVPGTQLDLSKTLMGFNSFVIW